MFFIKLLRKYYHLLLQKKQESYLDSLKERGLQIGENVIIMDACFFDPSHCFLISIGNNTTFAPNVRLIAHDASTKRALGYSRVGRIRIGSECFIGDSVIVLPGVSIGDKSVIASGSVVTKDIPEGSIAVGSPCRVIASQDNFIQKHKELIVKRKIPHAEFDQGTLSYEQKVEILEFLESDTGYAR